MRKITVHDLLDLQEEENFAKRALMLHEMKIPMNAKESARLRAIFAKHKTELGANVNGPRTEKEAIRELYFLLHSYLKSGLTNYRLSMPEIKEAYMEKCEDGQEAIERLFGGIIWVNQKAHEQRRPRKPQPIQKEISIYDLLEIQAEEHSAKRAFIKGEMKLPLSAEEGARLQALCKKHNITGNSYKELYFHLHDHLKGGLMNYDACISEMKEAYISSCGKEQGTMERLFGGVIWVNQKVHEKRLPQQQLCKKPH